MGARLTDSAEYAHLWGTEEVRAVFDQQARISITPEWARFYDFGAGKLPPFLRKLAGAD